MKIFKSIKNYIECLNVGIPYTIRKEWYNKNLHEREQYLQIYPFKENGMYIPPEQGNIITVVIREYRRTIHARYTITKVIKDTKRTKTIYSADNILVNLKFHSIIYII